MEKRNTDIRNMAKQKKVCLWQIADKLGIHEKTLVCRMRYELPEEQKTKVIAIIDEIATER